MLVSAEPAQGEALEVLLELLGESVAEVFVCLGWSPADVAVDDPTDPAMPGFKGSSQHLIDRGVLSYEVAETDSAEVGVVRAPAGAA